MLFGLLYSVQVKAFILHDYQLNFYSTMARIKTVKSPKSIREGNDHLDIHTLLAKSYDESKQPLMKLKDKEETPGLKWIDQCQ